MKKDWFTTWFDTPFYHLLYKDRNSGDAEFFMRKITEYLNLDKNAHIFDLPCGKGRHSLFLNSLGYTVTGGDLSQNSINYAKQFENDNLHFKVWDMRTPVEIKYDAIFNLFTSFGYFKEDSENIEVLKSIKEGLKPNSVLVIDFLNVCKLKNTIVSNEIKTIDCIEFHIKREIVNGFILKHISFIANNEQFSFTEQVKFIDLEKFKEYFVSAGLEIVEIFGNYSLDKFNPELSNRLILVIQKDVCV